MRFGRSPRFLAQFRPRASKGTALRMQRKAVEAGGRALRRRASGLENEWRIDAVEKRFAREVVPGHCRDEAYEEVRIGESTGPDLVKDRKRWLLQAPDQFRLRRREELRQRVEYCLRMLGILAIDPERARPDLRNPEGGRPVESIRSLGSRDAAACQ